MAVARNLFLTLAPLLLGNAAVAGDYTFTAGAEYTSGDYGTGINTTTWYVPVTLGYAADSFAWSVTVPYIRIDGSTLVSGVSTTGVRGRGGMQTTTTTTTVTNEQRIDSGLGDVILSASYLLQKETPARPWLALKGKVKLGTADPDKNLGTGENDYAVQFEVAKGAFDGFVGYNFLGDTAIVNYDNIVYGAAALSLPLQKWRVRSELYMEQASLAGADPVRELTITFSRPLSGDRQFSLYGIKGFTDSSPDWGVGLLLSSGF